MSYKKMLILLPAMAILLLGFQNCAGVLNSGIEFANTQAFLKNVSCSIFDEKDSNYSSCLDQQSGLLGRLYYLEDKTDGVEKPKNLYSKNGAAMAFDESTLNSVNVIIQHGFVSETYIMMPKIAVPQLSFTEGFKISENQYLVDASGKKLIEGFALDLVGNLHLQANQSPGTYEIALVSDDGSILDIDLKGSGKYERIIDNDGFHSPRMKCSSKFIELSRDSKYPIRLRYYQGPRTAIALTMLLRYVPNTSGLKAGSTDNACGSNIPNNYVNSDLKGRGWFIPEKNSFSFPSPYELAILGSNL